MRALLLAAGLGTRLRPITNSVPKCLVEINGRPLLDYWIELLSVGGIFDILINLHYMPEAVRSYIKSCPYPVNIATVHEERLLGTGGTILKNRSFFQDKPFMVIHADNLSLFNPSEFKASHERRPARTEITMMTFNAPDPKSCGIVEVNTEGIVNAFHEKVENPPGDLANAAVYILEPSVIEFLASLQKEIIDFSTKVLPHYIDRINTFHNGIYHRDIGTADSLSTAQLEYPIVAAKHRIQDDTANSSCTDCKL